MSLKILIKKFRYCWRPREQRSSSGRAPVGGRAGGGPAAPPQPAGEAGGGHAQPSSKSEEQHAGGAEHHQTGQPGKWTETSACPWSCGHRTCVQTNFLKDNFGLSFPNLFHFPPVSLRTQVVLVWVGLFCAGFFSCITSLRPQEGSNGQEIHPSFLVSLTDSGSVDASG